MIQERLRGMKDGAEKDSCRNGTLWTYWLPNARDAQHVRRTDGQSGRTCQSNGLIIDDDTAAKSAKLNRELKDLENTGKRLAVSIGHELVPVFNDYAKGVLDIAKEFESMTAEQKGSYRRNC